MYVEVSGFRPTAWSCVHCMWLVGAWHLLYMCTRMYAMDVTRQNNGTCLHIHDVQP